MKILALEFSSPQRGVAVVESAHAGGAAAFSEAVETGPPRRGALHLVEAALHEGQIEREQIDCLAVGLGPGSYTGIRAAIALAQGWQLARETRIVGVSTVECLVRQAREEKRFGRVHVVIDAQRNEIYLASYDVDANACREVEPLHLASLDEGRRRVVSGELVVGPEVGRLLGGGQIMHPRARVLGALAAGRSDYIPGEQLSPIYLRETSFAKAPPPRKLSE